jgi:hypothetical protein
MGRGPPEAIMRKLIRKYFKFDLKKKSFASASKYIPELQASWEKNGMDSKESAAIQAKIDAAVANEEKQYIELKQSVKKYPILMNNYLQKLEKEKNFRPAMKLPPKLEKVIVHDDEKDPFRDIKF